MATKLPEPEIEVTNAQNRDSSAPNGSVDIVIHRDGKGRSYRTAGGSTADVVKDAVKQIISDGYTGEWIPKSS